MEVKLVKIKDKLALPISDKILEQLNITDDLVKIKIVGDTVEISAAKKSKKKNCQPK